MGRFGFAESGHGRVQPAIQLHYPGTQRFLPFFPRIRGNSGLVSLSPWVQRVEPGHPCPPIATPARLPTTVARRCGSVLQSSGL
jgi:hypothetical protein